MAITNSLYDLTTEEFERLKFADAVMSSEAMTWLFSGSENWTQAHVESLRPLHAKWLEMGGQVWWKNASNATGT